MDANGNISFVFRRAFRSTTSVPPRLYDIQTRSSLFYVSSVYTSLTCGQGIQAEAFAYKPDSVDSKVGVRGKLD